MVLCLALLKVLFWMFGRRKVRLYGDNPSVQQSQSQIASGGVADGRGELRCLGGETDTSCSDGVCSFVNGSAHCSGCVVDGPSAVAVAAT